MTLLHSCYNWYPLCHWALSLVLPSLGCHFRDAGMCEKSDPVIYKHHPSRSSAAEKQRVKNKKHVWTLRENTVKSSSYCTLGFLVSFLGFRWGRFIDSFPAGTWVIHLINQQIQQERRRDDWSETLEINKLMSRQSRGTVWNQGPDGRFESVRSTHIWPCGTVRLRLLRTFSLP